MSTTEHTMNDTLADALRQTRHVWRARGVVSSENTGMLKGGTGRPDILVIEPNVSPVVVETEVLPATTVEDDAVSRLGTQLAGTGRTILSAVAVRLPRKLRTLEGEFLRSELRDASDLETCLFTGQQPTDFTRWPRAGWIPASVAELSILIQSASVPPHVVAQAANHLVMGVSEAAELLSEMAQQHPGALQKIAQNLHQEDGQQTRRMAMTILANAFLFQEGLAGGAGSLATINSLDELKSTSAGLGKSAILDQWRKILAINYWPIFDIARRILEAIPTADSKALIHRIAETAERLLESNLMRSHDLTGAVFQQLIADRKFLAAFYTTPASASLLVGLSIATSELLSGTDWADTQGLQKLRIADFACGTGTLLSTAYQRIGQLHELQGGNAEELHPAMMANVFVGCDVLPAAAHLTASMLSGTYPTVTYQRSAIMTVAYGKQEDERIALGSLDLLDPQGKLGVLAITAKLLEATGEAVRDTWLAVRHESFDWVIMNPPFTRATGHEGNKIGVPNPMFAAFSSSKEEQRLMSKAAQRLTKGTSTHGNAGEASYFLVLADRMLKAGGRLSLVMPLSLILGDAWNKSRALLAISYKDLIVVSIAGALDADLSFSADTGMGECLVIGQKVDATTAMRSRKKPKRAVFVVLNARPESRLIGAETAAQLRRLIASQQVRRLEDGPLGGTPIYFGDDQVGQCLDAPLATSGSWNLGRIADLSLAQTAYQLANKHRLWLPTMTEDEAVTVEMAAMATVGTIGPYHMDVNGNTPDGSIRGPFTITPIRPNSAPTYPVLWKHKAKEQRTMSFVAESEGMPRKAMTARDQAIVADKIAEVWKTASHCHFNRDFRFNSQSTGMQFTPQRAIGGRAWLSVCLESLAQEKAMVAWGNTSLGLLLQWWHANKQQAGRGSVGKSPLRSLPVLDVRALTVQQLAKAVAIFDAFQNKPLRPIHELDVDATRQEMDRRFVHEVLGLPAPFCAEGGPLELLWKKLAWEPSIRGAK